MTNLLTNAGLWGAIIGGVLTSVGSILTQLAINSRQKKLRQREELLPVASRALQSAQQSWLMLETHAFAASREDGKGGAGTPAGELLARWDDAYRSLELALEELSLLVPNIDSENEQLMESLRIGTLLPGREHSKQEKTYRSARTALQKRLRQFLGTSRNKL